LVFGLFAVNSHDGQLICSQYRRKETTISQIKQNCEDLVVGLEMADKSSEMA
jgi:hypothetical protein